MDKEKLFALANIMRTAPQRGYALTEPRAWLAAVIDAGGLAAPEYVGLRALAADPRSGLGAYLRWLYRNRELLPHEPRPEITEPPKFGCDWNCTHATNCLQVIASLVEADAKRQTGQASLSESESNIVQALGASIAFASAETLSKAAGYPNNSNFRATLAGMVARGILEKGPKGRGYRVRRVT